MHGRKIHPSLLQVEFVGNTRAENIALGRAGVLDSIAFNEILRTGRSPCTILLRIN